MVIVFLSGTTLILGDHCNTIRDDATKYKGKPIKKFGLDPLHKPHPVVTFSCSDIPFSLLPYDRPTPYLPIRECGNSDSPRRASTLLPPSASSPVF